MENKDITDQMNRKLEEIKSGQIFDIPEGYFAQLEHRIFVERRSEFIGRDKVREKKRKVFQIWKPLSYAASFLLVAGLMWWMTKDGLPGSGWNDRVNDSLVEQYLLDQIMEYDLEYLTSGLSDEDLQSLSLGDIPYEAYISAYIEDFEEFIY